MQIKNCANDRKELQKERKNEWIDGKKEEKQIQ